MAGHRARIPVQASTRHMTAAEIKRKVDAESKIRTEGDEIMKPPSWLDSTAKKEWKRVVPQLLKIEVVGNLDFSAIAGYCAAFSGFKQTTEKLKSEPFTKMMPDGRVVENPLLRTQREFAAEMRKFADMSGMSISSRLKAAMAKVNETEKDIKDEFGDI